MQTLSYGYKLPESGDKGSTLWSALEDNITRLNGHTHNGTDSPLLPVQSFILTKQSIDHANWASYSGAPTGHVRQLVTMPAGFTFDDFCIDVRDTSGKKCYPTIEKNDNTSYYIYSIDSTLDLVAVYGT